MRVIPPFFIAVLMLASPVANTRIPQASERPTLELPVADPVKNPTQTAVSANRRASFFMAFLSVEGPASSDASSTVTGAAHGNNASPRHGEGGQNNRLPTWTPAATGSSPSTTRARRPAPTAKLATFRERAGRRASGTLDAARRAVAIPVRQETYDTYGAGSDYWSDRRARQSKWGAPIWPPKPPSARKRPGQPGALLDRLATAPRSPGYFSLEKLATFSRRRKSRRS